jgi:uncharacterized protein YkwD
VLRVGAGLVIGGVLLSLLLLEPGSARAPRAHDRVDERVAGVVVTREPTEPQPEPAPPPSTTPDTEPAPAPAPEPSAPPEVRSEPRVDPPPQGCGSVAGDSLAAQIVAAHRRVRCDLGLSGLTEDPALVEHATYQAGRLADAGACSTLFHSTELGAWYTTQSGENEACVLWSKGCWGDANYIMDGWMASPSHRVHIAEAAFTRIGVAVLCRGTQTYVVVHFRA